MAAQISAEELMTALTRIAPWIRGVSEHQPARAEIAAAVRLSARYLAQLHPGKTVELRVPPFVAVQLIEGTTHTRGTPPHVVECDPDTWLGLVIGTIPANFDNNPKINASGIRSGEVAALLPLIKIL
ncbi:Uncharacterised protein [Corynebacterium kutscheri]|uniref:Bacterial SCP orthologue domain-containing protein n=2 Tax=Corynebacterium kutscheri TaxID=35755 RepID=A0A0F6QZL1_9CORY|nr:hypothetical protein UL82_02830 [Corynebacterium kutscheri]VEH04494.1 Uncharacterised protein [Corynebacterium kutscheri]VEH09087.1 Uncharacterised protein [Corynebacterium kutscheri]VEH80334.1 Uncharacterised protein [Corynebacterium kutscheri]